LSLKMVEKGRSRAYDEGGGKSKKPIKKRERGKKFAL